MAIDRRRANINWSVLDERGGRYQGDYADAQLAVLMDLRDQLEVISRKLSALECPNFVAVPRTLTAIECNTRKPKRKKKAATR